MAERSRDGARACSPSDPSAALSRREALRAGAVAGGALVVGGLALPGAASAQASQDLVDFIEGLVELEQAAAFAYARAAEAKGVDRQAVEVFERFGSQEQAHANAMISAFETVSGGEEAPEPPDDPEDSELLDGIESLRGSDEWLDFLLEVEQAQIDAYLERIVDVPSTDLVRTIAEIVSCQAQHQVLLRQLAGEQPAQAVPEAIVTATAGGTGGSGGAGGSGGSGGGNGAPSGGGSSDRAGQGADGDG